jgi:hypothetical protein
MTGARIRAYDVRVIVNDFFGIGNACNTVPVPGTIMCLHRVVRFPTNELQRKRVFAPLLLVVGDLVCVSSSLVIGGMDVEAMAQ